MVVFVLDSRGSPLMPCAEKRARQLLQKNQAEVERVHPFVIRLKNFTPSVRGGLRLKIDPGFRYTGLALLDGEKVVWLCEVHHRTDIVENIYARAMYRRNRRSRKTRYRASRINNRRIPAGWLPPSARARLDELMSAVSKVFRWAPVNSISVEHVKFDTQKLQNPEISGIEYQNGELKGVKEYEIRAYLQEKFNHTCVYCGKKDYENPGLKFTVEHVFPRSRGGSDRVSNLVYACATCNTRRKGSKTAAEFGYPEVAAMASKPPLRDVAAVNVLRKVLVERLEALGVPVERGTGGMTKYNRAMLKLPKTHCIDAVCVGASTPCRIASLPVYYDVWTCKGRGSRKMANQIDAYGFPKAHRSRQRRINGFSSGDVVKCKKGKYSGVVGPLVASKQSPYIYLDKKRYGVSYKNIVLVQRNDGWLYSRAKLESAAA